MDAVDSWSGVPRGFTDRAGGDRTSQAGQHCHRPPPARDGALLYVTELYGRVMAITPDCKVHTFADGLLNYQPDFSFPGTGESGVTGICVDPASGDVLASMVYKDSEDVFSKVVRMSTSDGLTADKVETIIDGIPSVLSAHQVQALTVGPDGKLYVNVGDGYLAPEAAQRDDDLRGKVLRMNMDGSVPADNPTPGSLVYAKGFRNPFGGAWRRSDRSLYITDNGRESYDRIAPGRCWRQLRMAS